MRGEGASQGKIAEATGVKYSTVLSILGSRIYLGEVQMNGEWFPGHHERSSRRRPSPPPIGAGSRAEPGAPTSCRAGCAAAMCQRLMALDQNGEGRKLYRCHHRGQGCSQPRRTNIGLHRGCRAGLAAHRRRRRTAGRHPPGARAGPTPAPKAGGGPALGAHVTGSRTWMAQRRKLLRLYYDDKIGADLFAEEEARLSVAIREAQRESDDARRRGGSGPTMSPSTSTTSPRCSQRSTSTRRGRPPRTSSGAC